MAVRAIDDKSSDTLVVVSGEGFWTGSSTLPHLHHFFALRRPWAAVQDPNPAHHNSLAPRDSPMQIFSWRLRRESQLADDVPLAQYCQTRSAEASSCP